MHGSKYTKLAPYVLEKSLRFENKFCLLFAGKCLQSVLDFVVKFYLEYAKLVVVPQNIPNNQGFSMYLL